MIEFDIQGRFDLGEFDVAKFDWTDISLRGGAGEKQIETDWPNEEGLTKDWTKQKGRDTTLTAEKNLSKDSKEGLN